MGTTHYDLDPLHSTVGFSIRHMMVTTQRGQFHGVTGSSTSTETIGPAAA